MFHLLAQTNAYTLKHWSVFNFLRNLSWRNSLLLYSIISVLVLNGFKYQQWKKWPIYWNAGWKCRTTSALVCLLWDKFHWQSHTFRLYMECWTENWCYKSPWFIYRHFCLTLDMISVMLIYPKSELTKPCRNYKVWTQRIQYS